MFDIPITLITAALAGLLNIWLAVRCSQVRIRDKVSHGDGGNGLLARRMRAHANFIENAPLVLLLILAIEASQNPRGIGELLLGIAGLAFIAARVLHALGMEADRPHPARIAGSMTSLVVMAALSIAALLAGLDVI